MTVRMIKMSVADAARAGLLDAPKKKRTTRKAEPRHVTSPDHNRFETVL
jgi:hypothetical protein